MSGIPRYNNAPLNARSGVPVPPTGPSPPTSQTASAPSAMHTHPKPNPTTTSSPHPSYPHAQPAAAVPHATGLANPQRYAPAHAVMSETEKAEPTRTIKEDSEVPPAPQPAAFPKPTTGFAGNRTFYTHAAGAQPVPPPPKAGQAPTMHQVVNAGPHGMEKGNMEYPPQMTIPPPSITRAPFSSTMTLDAGTAATTGSTSHNYMPRSMHPQPVSVGDAYPSSGVSVADTRPEGETCGASGTARRSLEHPPGYVQNAYAAELSSDQRRAMDVSGRGEANGSGSVFGGGGGGGGDGDGDEGGFWGSAKRWVGSAGE